MKITTESIAQVDLGVSERFSVKRTRLVPDELSHDARRISIITGTHGDELEGQYVCYELISRIKQHSECLRGIVDVYPALNPLGIDSMTRGIPNFDLDLNRLFPGREDGSMPERYAKEVVEDIAGSDLSIDIHASNIFLYEIPQIRINELTEEALMPYALQANVDYIWVHSAATVLESTLAYSLNDINTPCLVVEMGIGMRITPAYGDQLIDGLFNLMYQMGIWTGEVDPVRYPRISKDGKVRFINANASGIFMPTAEHTSHVEAGQNIGNIVSPLTGEVVEELYAPSSGLMFTLRAYPIVYAGSLIARILADSEGEA